MTHSDLVAAAARWLKSAKRCRVVLGELVTGVGEIPDAIGWTGGGWSFLVECKASRADFRADALKYRRRAPQSGMGAYRYYLTPPGLLLPDEVPEGWGLLEAGTRVRTIRESKKPGEEWGAAFPERNHVSEIAMLLSLIRRMKSGGVRGKARVEIEAYRLDEKGNPLPETAADSPQLALATAPETEEATR